MRSSPLSFLPAAAGMLVLVLSLALSVLLVARRGGTPQNIGSRAGEQVASLMLSPTTGDYTFSPNTDYPVGIVVDTAGKVVDGVDVVINFDPARVQVVGTRVEPTTILEEYPLNKIDNTKGEIKFSALTFNPKALAGVAGTFRFRPLARGEVNLTINFTPEATTDSNIAEHGTAKDILGKVLNGSYFFR